MAKLSSRAARIKTAAETAFGPRGLTRLAKAAGISKQMLSFIVTGAKPVSDDVYRKFAEALDKEAARLEGVAVKLVKLSYQMLEDLPRPRG